MGMGWCCTYTVYCTLYSVWYNIDRLAMPVRWRGVGGVYRGLCRIKRPGETKSGLTRLTLSSLPISTSLSLSYSSSFSLRKSIKQQQHQRKRILLSLQSPATPDRPNGGTRTNELISLGELNERGEEECGTAVPSTLAAFFLYFLLCGCVCRRLSYLRGLEKIYAAVCCC